MPFQAEGPADTRPSRHREQAVWGWQVRLEDHVVPGNPRCPPLCRGCCRRAWHRRPPSPMPGQSASDSSGNVGGSGTERQGERPTAPRGREEVEMCENAPQTEHQVRCLTTEGFTSALTLAPSSLPAWARAVRSQLRMPGPQVSGAAGGGAGGRSPESLACPICTPIPEDLVDPQLGEKCPTWPWVPFPGLIPGDGRTRPSG